MLVSWLLVGRLLVSRLLISWLLGLLISGLRLRLLISGLRLRLLISRLRLGLLIGGLRLRLLIGRLRLRLLICRLRLGLLIGRLRLGLRGQRRSDCGLRHEETSKLGHLAGLHPTAHALAPHQGVGIHSKSYQLVGRCGTCLLVVGIEIKIAVHKFFEFYEVISL